MDFLADSERKKRRQSQMGNEREKKRGGKVTPEMEKRLILMQFLSLSHSLTENISP
jgi:hypothetical protein